MSKNIKVGFGKHARFAASESFFFLFFWVYVMGAERICSLVPSALGTFRSKICSHAACYLKLHCNFFTSNFRIIFILSSCCINSTAERVE